MLTYRLKGLLNLHVVATALLATAYFLAFALAVPHLPLVQLNPDVNLLLYATPVLMGMLFSAQFWRPLAPRFHLISVVDAVAISTRQVALIALLEFTLIVATKDRSVSRLFLAVFLISAWLLLIIVNRRLPHYIAKMAFSEGHHIRTIFAGAPAAIGRLGSWIAQKQHLGIRVTGIVSDDPRAAELPSMPLLGRISDLRRVIGDRSIGQVILLDVPDDPAEMLAIVEACQSTGSRLLVYQNVWGKLPVRMIPVVEQEHLFLTVHDEPLEDPFNRAVKRAFDIVLSLPVVLLVLPVLCISVSIVQKLQAPGPLMFKRPRGGQRQRSFGMLKFRSMYVHDPTLESRQATEGDPRIYPFGRFLRRSSLDEFPQFWNVLVGDMSIVGPRPHLPKHDEEFSAVAKTYRTRQLVKPGITGLAQVRGFRGEISETALLHERVKLDIHYITHWSIWLDIQITGMTLIQVFFPPKAAR